MSNRTALLYWSGWLVYAGLLNLGATALYFRGVPPPDSGFVSDPGPKKGPEDKNPGRLPMVSFADPEVTLHAGQSDQPASVLKIEGAPTGAITVRFAVANWKGGDLLPGLPREGNAVLTNGELRLPGRFRVPAEWQENVEVVIRLEGAEGATLGERKEQKLLIKGKAAGPPTQVVVRSITPVRANVQPWCESARVLVQMTGKPGKKLRIPVSVSAEGTTASNAEYELPDAVIVEQETGDFLDIKLKSLPKPAEKERTLTLVFNVPAGFCKAGDSERRVTFHLAAAPELKAKADHSTLMQSGDAKDASTEVTVKRPDGFEGALKVHYKIRPPRGGEAEAGKDFDVKPAPDADGRGTIEIADGSNAATLRVTARDTEDFRPGELPLWLEFEPPAGARPPAEPLELKIKDGKCAGDVLVLVLATKEFGVGPDHEAALYQQLCEGLSGTGLALLGKRPFWVTVDEGTFQDPVKVRCRPWDAKGPAPAVTGRLFTPDAANACDLSYGVRDCLLARSDVLSKVDPKGERKIRTLVVWLTRKETPEKLAGKKGTTELEPKDLTHLGFLWLQVAQTREHNNETLQELIKPGKYGILHPGEPARPRT